MVQAMINIDENTNRVLNIVKAKFGLNDKSQAINMMAQQYEESILEPELKPAYVQKIKHLEKSGKFKRYKTLASLRKQIERT